MKTFGIVSYNIHANFTNYGSALQSWAVSEVVKRLGYGAILLDYCPDCLKDKDILDPMKNMWDTDEESKRNCELSLPAIRENYVKFERFYTNRFSRSKKVYTKENFCDVMADEKLDGFLCGGDTILCIDEFGFDDGYYADYPCMRKGFSIVFGASFGDSHFDESKYAILNQKLANFKAMGIREKWMIPYLSEHSDIPIKQVLDPTLLLPQQYYKDLAEPKRLVNGQYLLLYARRYNKKMFDYAENLAKQMGWKIVDISLRAENPNNHIMYYHAGVEEFLALVRDCEYLVTNSYHGFIMGLEFERPFVVFSREQCDRKIDELLEMLGLSNRKMFDGMETVPTCIDFNSVFSLIKSRGAKSMDFLDDALSKC